MGFMIRHGIRDSAWNRDNSRNRDNSWNRGDSWNRDASWNHDNSGNRDNAWDSCSFMRFMMIHGIYDHSWDRDDSCSS